MGRHFLLFILKIAMRIDCGPEAAISIRDALKHCYVFVFCIFGRGVISGLEFFCCFCLLFILI